MVRNHPFTDGNKRSGAFLFVDFLHRNNRLLDEQEQPIINDMMWQYFTPCPLIQAMVEMEYVLDNPQYGDY